MKKALEEWVPLSCLMTTLQLLTDVWRSISGRDEIEKIFINFFLALNELDKNTRPLVIMWERTYDKR